MFHNKAFRKLGRKHTHRVATLRALSTSLFEHGRITTTLMKAKELRPFAEKLITKSKREDLHARRLVVRHIQNRAVARRLFDELSARYMERNGGYMRILKLGRRQGDGAEMALVELLGSEPVFEKKEEEKKPGLASRLLRGKRGKGAPVQAAAPHEEAEPETAAPASEETEDRKPAPSKKAKGKAAATPKRPSKGSRKK